MMDKIKQQLNEYLDIYADVVDEVLNNEGVKKVLEYYDWFKDHFSSIDLVEKQPKEIWSAGCMSFQKMYNYYWRVGLKKIGQTYRMQKITAKMHAKNIAVIAQIMKLFLALYIMNYTG